MTHQFINRFHQQPYENAKYGKDRWKHHQHPKQIRNENRKQQLFDSTPHITFHGYKKNRRERFQEVDGKISCRNVSDTFVPPLPRFFLYNPDFERETIRRKASLPHDEGFEKYFGKSD